MFRRVTKDIFILFHHHCCCILLQSYHISLEPRGLEATMCIFSGQMKHVIYHTGMGLQKRHTDRPCGFLWDRQCGTRSDTKCLICFCWRRRARSVKKPKPVQPWRLPTSLMLIYAFDLVTKLNSNVNEYSFIEASAHPISKRKGWGLGFLFHSNPLHSIEKKKNFEKWWN